MALITVRQALNDAFKEEMRRDGSIVLFGCDIGVRGNPFGVTKGLLEEFGPQRVVDTPISEACYTGVGIGAAACGLRPMIELLYSDWITLAMDQIVNMAAKMRYMFGGNINLPMVIRAPFGAGGGMAAQHVQCFESWFTHVPGLKVVAPVMPYDVKGLLKTALRDENPVIFFEHKRGYTIKGEVPQEEYTVPLGRASVVREGRDVTVVAYSMMVLRALDAAEAVAQSHGISCEVIDLRTLMPLDYDTVMTSIAKTNRVVACQEAPLRGGLCSDIVAEIVSRGFDLLDAPPERVGSLNVPVPYNRAMENAVVAGVQQIRDAVVKVMSNA